MSERSAERLSTSFGAVAAKRKGHTGILQAILSLRLRAWQGLKGHDHFTVWQVLFPSVLSRQGHYGPRQAVIWLRKARCWAQRPPNHHLDRQRSFIPTVCCAGQTESENFNPARQAGALFWGYFTILSIRQSLEFSDNSEWRNKQVKDDVKNHLLYFGSGLIRCVTVQQITSLFITGSFYFF